MMAGFLLARAGLKVVVLEKHADFLRDFRGDTIHPSTLQVLSELGLIERFLQIPHEKVRHVTGLIGGTAVKLADFTHLNLSCPYIAFMPQWDFLNFLAKEATSFPSFELKMNAQVTGLIRKDEQVLGAIASTPQGEIRVEADLVLGTDGRHSTVRHLAGLKVRELGAPMDILWMRLSRKPADPHQVFGVINRGKIFVMLDRGTYWQCAFVIPKGHAENLRARGIEAFRRDVVDVEPSMHDRVAELKSWDDVKLLTVAVDRLETWCMEGLLCIGDAAHAMSPIGGVGINLAIQDAVAAANLLAPVLATRAPKLRDLLRVQKRRYLPTFLTQGMQLVVQRRVITAILKNNQPTKVNWFVRLIGRFPILQRVPARIMGVGFRPEHVKKQC